MREFPAAAVALATLMTATGAGQLTKVDVSLGDVSINKVPQLVAADQHTEIHDQRAVPTHILRSRESAIHLVQVQLAGTLIA